MYVLCSKLVLQAIGAGEREGWLARLRLYEVLHAVGIWAACPISVLVAHSVHNPLSVETNRVIQAIQVF